jgi:hypothetical protein
MFIKEIVKTLGNYGVDYALVGGYAVALHGAIRGTVDIDLVITIDLDQFCAAEQALLSLGLEPRLPVKADEVYNFREEYMRNRNLSAWSFYNPKNPLEIVDIMITNDLRDMKTVKKKINRMTIKVASIPDLIKMKQASGRPQDIEDIKALERL